MERVRIAELKLHYQRTRKKKTTHDEIGAYVFKGDVTRPKNGKATKLSPSRKTGLIARWNTGHDLTALKPRHMLRLAEFFKVEKLVELIEA